MQFISELQASETSEESLKARLEARSEPIVIRGLTKHWPIVANARHSSQDLIDYLTGRDSGAKSYTIVAQPQEQGRFFYSDNLSSRNYESANASISEVLRYLIEFSEQESAPAMSMQAASIAECLPGFTHDHSLPIVSQSVQPTLWISGPSRVAAHYDLNDNIACVAAGRRRFTLFPPEQVANLYVGPSLNSPGGVPISMVDLQNPDWHKHPRFAHALDSALTATLEPGDAIFIPSPWWHAVESLESLNVLINYWWSDFTDSGLPTAGQCMTLSMMAIAKMDKEQRHAWQHFFDYFVFQTQASPRDHLPEHLEDPALDLEPETQQRLLQSIVRPFCDK